MQTHLVVVSVPWRKSSLEQLLSSLVHQTFPVDRVTLLLQRYPGLPSIPVQLGARVSCLNLRRNTGPAVRWVWIEKHMPADDIALVLDDDFVLEPTYVQTTLAPIHEGWADATGWYGIDRAWGYYPATKRVARALPMHVLAGGACAMRARFMRGLGRHPLASHLTRLDGGDDLLSSATMRRNGARLWRPRGGGPLASTSAQQDLRSIRWTRGADVGKLFMASEIL